MPAGFVQTFLAFAHNNAWANHRLLTACAGLSQQQFEAKRTGFFPSLQMTLNHIYVIDLFYVDALEGGWLGPKAWANEIPCPSVAELRPAQAEVDKRLIAVCNTLTPASSTTSYASIATRGCRPNDATPAHASVPAPDSSSRAGTRHAFRNSHRTATA
jgi:uncharacterized damage-inducible protein DinB